MDTKALICFLDYSLAAPRQTVPGQFTLSARSSNRMSSQSQAAVHPHLLHIYVSVSPQRSRCVLASFDTASQMTILEMQ